MERLIENPEFDEAGDLLEEYLSREYTLQVVGLCSVNYQGRAKSKLDRGERLVVSKQDSALLVHGPENYQPKNWQPEVDSYSVSRDGDILVLKARRNSPDELVEIRFEEIEMIAVNKLVDRSELKVKGHEVDIHEAIEDEPEILEEGIKIVERERETPAGFIDLFCRDEDGKFVVVEVKRNPDYNTVLQLQRYVDEIEEEFSAEVRGILASPKMTDNVLDYLEERDLEFIEVEMVDVISDYDEIDDGQKGLSDFGPDYSVGK